MGFELKRKLDYSDLQVTPDDGRRYELLEGKLHVSASPNPMHQRVSSRLERRLEDFFHGRSIAEVFHAPIDLILTGQDVFVPDIVVVDPRHVSKRGIEGPPLLVVEILSLSTRAFDLGAKSQRYAELGVEHYWAVDLEARRLQCYRAVGGTFQLLAEAQGDETLVHPAWDGLSIDLGRIWL
jgi:Uma2 family endonuclease